MSKITMQNMRFNLYDFSLYRGELMGFATICILICHASPAGVDMSDITRKYLSYGNLGVEVFFFLSGIGLNYSLSKGSPYLISWYKKRFIRILLPYLLIAAPWFFITTLLSHNSWIDFLLDVSTISFWLYHKGAWFIATLIPLYLVTPFIYGCLKGKYRIYWLIPFVVMPVMVGFINPDNDVIANIIFAVNRLPCFFCGMYIAPYVQKKVSLPFFAILFFSIILIVVRKYVAGCGWLLVFLLMPLICLLISRFRPLQRSLAFMGTISLESYIMNICLKDLYLKDLLVFNALGGVNYICIILFGTIIAYGVNRLTFFLIQKTDKK